MCTSSDRTLQQFIPEHEFFIGVDSDGCVFDSMTVKQEQFFFPAIIRCWGLETIADAVCEVARFVNLASRWRGSNRFVALLKTFELLAGHPGVSGATHILPDTNALRTYIASGLPLGNTTLKQLAESSQDPGLRRLLDWSSGLNATISREMQPIPPFPGVAETLAKMATVADIVVVSQTPEPTLKDEWRQHGLITYVCAIAGQEAGSKAEHLSRAAVTKYPPQNILLLGDAPGDLDAAKTAGTLFYPILPGAETASWSRFKEEAFSLFMNHQYAGRYEQARIAEFEECLTATPPWSEAA